MRITKGELIAMANSSNADDRKRAFKLYQAWIKAAPTLSFQDKLSTTERHLLVQVFISRGLMQAPPLSRVQAPPPKPRA